MTIENLLIIYETDFKRRNWLDWVISHIMFSSIVHRFSVRAIIETDQSFLKAMINRKMKMLK